MRIEYKNISISSNKTMYDHKAYQAEYRNARKNDDERRQKYNDQVKKCILRKYHEDEEFREEFKRKRRERYHEMKQKRLQSAA